MAKTVSIGGKIAALDALLALLNAGGAGQFRVLTSGSSLLAQLTFAATSFLGATNVGGIASANSGTITASGAPTAGTIAKGSFRNNAGTSVIDFAIGTSASDLNVTDNVIPGGATSVTCSGLTVTLDVT